MIEKDDKLDRQLQANIEGNFELGWQLVQELEKERPECNRCAFNRGWMLLRNGEFKKGFDCINRGRYENVFGSPPLQTDKPIWGLKNPATQNSKHILFRSEGGLGDEMINARFIKIRLIARICYYLFTFRRLISISHKNTSLIYY